MDVYPYLAYGSYHCFFVCLLDHISCDLRIAVILGRHPFQCNIESPYVHNLNIQRRTRLVLKKKSTTQNQLCIIKSYSSVFLHRCDTSGAEITSGTDIFQVGLCIQFFSYNKFTLPNRDVKYICSGSVF